MNTTPLWVPLVVAGIGLFGTVVGTVSGVLIAQRRSDRREAEAWGRERERERERWVREDVLRNFEQRRDAYIGFYATLREMARTAYDRGMGLAEPGELPVGWNMPAARKHEYLRVYASPEVLAAAGDAYNTCWRWCNNVTYGNDDEKFYEGYAEFNSADQVLHDAIRRDLGLTSVIEDGRPLPGSGWAVDGE